MAVALPPMRVLVVEHLALRRSGHYMARLQDTCEALVADGHEVHVLTAFGLAIEAEGRSLEGVSGVHLPARRWTWLHKVGVRLWPTVATQGQTRLRSLPRRVIGVTARQVADVRGIAECAHRLSPDGNIAVVIQSPRVHVAWACVLAPSRARWMVHCHRLPPDEVQGARLLIDLGKRLAKAREMRRRARGGHVEFLLGNPTFAAVWKRRYPWLDPEVVVLSGYLEAATVPRVEARRELSLPEGAPIGMLFGGAHAGKDLATVFLAFAGDDAPAHLVAAGHGVDKVFEAVERDHPELTFPKVHVFAGSQSDRMKQLLLSAADFSVLSFRSDWASDSGTLKDAIDYGIPVCCSEGSFPAALVRDHRLGVTFAPGDPDALRAAVERVRSFELTPDAIASFAEVYAVPAIARRFLSAAVNGRAAS